MSVESVRILTLRLLSALSSRPSTAHAEAPPPHSILYCTQLSYFPASMLVNAPEKESHSLKWHITATASLLLPSSI